MIGTQIPILLALCEYGFILYLKRKTLITENQAMNLEETGENLDDKIRKLDYGTMVFSFIYLVLFVSLYWIILFTIYDEKWRQNSLLIFKMGFSVYLGGFASVMFLSISCYKRCFHVTSTYLFSKKFTVKYNVYPKLQNFMLLLFPGT